MKSKVLLMILIFIFLIFAMTTVNYASLVHGGGGGSASRKL